MKRCEKEKMLAGEIYNPSDPELSRLAIEAKHKAYLLNQCDPSDSMEYEKRLRSLFSLLGPNSYIAPNVQVDYGINFATGKNFFANYGLVVLDCCPVTVGDDVMCGVGVHIVTPVHPLLSEERSQRLHEDGRIYDYEYAKPISIGNGVWLASDVTVCGGVRIGDRSVIAAGAVVVNDIPPGVLAGGVPCKVIRKLTEEDRLGIYKANGD